MTRAACPSILLIQPPAATLAGPPSNLAQLESWLSGVSAESVAWDAFVRGSLKPAAGTVLFMCPEGSQPDRWQDLSRILNPYRGRLRLSLCREVDDRTASDPSDMEGLQSIVQLRWRVTGRMPDLGFFKIFSRAGVWNHLILDGAAATSTNIDTVARQPNIVHSWEAGGRVCDSPSVYHGVQPLPGRPLWRAVADPVRRTAMVERFGRDWLLRSRVDDDGQWIRGIGENLDYRYSPPDRLPDGHLDEISAMVAAGGTVAPRYVRFNLERAFLIGTVQERGVIVGNSSLKHPRPEYIDSVRRQSGLDLTGFVERGYTSVRPEYRGLGIGTRLLEGLTARAGDRKIFSVIAEDNTATQTIARRNRTRQVATYFSQKAGKPVGIWMPEWMIE